MTSHDRPHTEPATRDPLVIRRVVRADLPALEWDGEFTHFRGVFLRSYLEQQAGERLLLVAICRQDIVGRLFILRRKEMLARPLCQRRGYLHSFHVRDGYRSIGIGAALLSHAERCLGRLQVPRAILAVACTNLGAQRFYRRHGYHILSREISEWSYVDHRGVLRHVTEPCYLLEKALQYP